jgi:hypothetical protein
MRTLKENLKKNIEEAFEKDREAILNRQPAIYRLRAGPSVFKTLQNLNV